MSPQSSAVSMGSDGGKQGGYWSSLVPKNSQRPRTGLVLALAAVVATTLPLIFAATSSSENGGQWLRCGAGAEGVRRSSPTPILTTSAAQSVGGGTATSGHVFSGDKIRRFSAFPGPLPKPCSLPRLQTSTGAPCKSWAVTTTINSVTESVAHTCDHLRDWCLVVVADLKTPKDYSYTPANGSGCRLIYVDVDTQKEWARSCGFVAELPWNHFSRKNIGYLAAIVNGAEHVWDFDDDNELFGPHPVDLIKAMTTTTTAAATAGSNNHRLWTLPNFRTEVINPYPLLGSTTFSWPRGFPLSRIRDNATMPTKANVSEAASFNSDDNKRIALVQSLAQIDPDVDAVYRLTRPIPFTFAHPAATILEVPRGTYVPLNAQATLLRMRSALWTLLLPRTVHGRVSDIWRAYFMQRLMADYGMSIAFSGAWVAQHRNPHSYIADFDSELPLYLRTDALVRVLSEWKNTGSTLPESALALYVDLYERGYIEMDDVVLLKTWLDALTASGYEFPTRSIDAHVDAAGGGGAR